MRFLLTEEFWVLDALNSAEWHFINELPDTAAGLTVDKRYHGRLFPPPLAEDELMNEENYEQLEDWDEFIKPDLKTAFDDARDTVTTDIAQANPVPEDELKLIQEEEESHGIEPSNDKLIRLVVPIDHSENWYSALNQARLLLNEAHNLAEASQRFHLLGEEDEIDPREAMLLAQYEMYSAIQGILVENVMQ